MDFKEFINEKRKTVGQRQEDAAREHLDLLVKGQKDSERAKDLRNRYRILTRTREARGDQYGANVVWPGEEGSLTTDKAPKRHSRLVSILRAAFGRPTQATKAAKKLRAFRANIPKDNINETPIMSPPTEKHPEGVPTHYEAHPRVVAALEGEAGSRTTMRRGRQHSGRGKKKGVRRMQKEIDKMNKESEPISHADATGRAAQAYWSAQVGANRSNKVPTQHRRQGVADFPLLSPTGKRATPVKQRGVNEGFLDWLKRLKQKPGEWTEARSKRADARARRQAFKKADQDRINAMMAQTDTKNPKTIKNDAERAEFNRLSLIHI
mgnify:CR=1 FL=1